MNWFTADYHLSHKKIIEYCNRPFRNIEEMDEIILNNLESTIQPNDILYFLGDVTFKDDMAENFFKQFNNIQIHYLIGNHDNIDVLKIAKKYCKSVAYLKDIIIEGISITLCHYAMRVWNQSHLNAWQLYGHSHAQLSPIGKQYDVGVDNNNFKPVSFKFLLNIMAKLPNNLNYIPPENRKSKHFI
jgi:calcineurin-like phosphoesterase family protein